MRRAPCVRGVLCELLLVAGHDRASGVIDYEAGRLCALVNGANAFHGHAAPRQQQRHTTEVSPKLEALIEKTRYWVYDCPFGPVFQWQQYGLGCEFQKICTI